MPAVADTVVKVTKVGNQFTIQFANGIGMVFNSLAEMREFAEAWVSQDTSRQLLLAWWLARSADGSNVAIVEGKTLTFDLSAPSAIKVQ